MTPRTIHANRDDWERLARAVRERRADLGLTMNDVVLASRVGGNKGIGRSVVSMIENTHQTDYAQRSLRLLSTALAWTPASAERILARETPEEAPELDLARDPGPSDAPLATIRRQWTEAVKDHERSLAVLMERTAALEAALTTSDASGVRSRPIRGTQSLLDTDEVATWLGVSPTTLRTWRTRGGGPPATKVGNAVRYQRSAVQAWLDARSEDRTPTPL